MGGGWRSLRVGEGGVIESGGGWEVIDLLVLAQLSIVSPPAQYLTCVGPFHIYLVCVPALNCVMPGLYYSPSPPWSLSNRWRVHVWCLEISSKQALFSMRGVHIYIFTHTHTHSLCVLEGIVDNRYSCICWDPIPPIVTSSHCPPHSALFCAAW